MGQVCQQYWSFGLVLMVVVFSWLAGGGYAALGQEASAAFWELQPQQVEAMRFPVPEDNDRRYARLRVYFSDLHCTSDRMEEQAIRKHSVKNLICVLPGKETEQIVVAARYERRGRVDDAADGWSEAVMLPLLYNALQAAPRQYTFVFVALGGSAGQEAYLDRFWQKHQPPPKAMVVLDVLGVSSPWFATLPGASLTAKDRARTAMNKRLQAEALFTARLQGISIPSFPYWSAQSTLLSDADQIPSILVYSGSRQDSSPVAFHQGFEFLAYFLGRIDAKLATPAAPEKSPAPGNALANPAPVPSPNLVPHPAPKQ